jgi:GntR family transcriptional repressor for pyruvate dehydrogenase complex
MKDSSKSTPAILFEEMLERIRTGQWPTGAKIPSERTLMARFGVSRVSVRETLSMLRALGVLSTSQGRRSVVQKMDSKVLGKMFPLILSLEGQKTYQQIFEVRLALESRTSYLAAVNRTESDLSELYRVLERLKKQLSEDLENSIDSDLQFHIQVARSTRNPLFPLMLEALSGFVKYVQVLSCKGDPARRERALHFHESVAEAIKDKDPERARVEMESHLRTSADRILKSGMLVNS